MSTFGKIRQRIEHWIEGLFLRMVSPLVELLQLEITTCQRQIIQCHQELSYMRDEHGDETSRTTKDHAKLTEQIAEGNEGLAIRISGCEKAIETVALRIAQFGGQLFGERVAAKMMDHRNEPRSFSHMDRQ